MPSSRISEEDIVSRIEVSIAILISILSVSYFIYIVIIFGSSFDFTDESYYLISIDEYYSFPSSVTQFGFVYHWLYVLVGKDVFLLRAANLLVTLGLAFWLSFLLLKLTSLDVGQDFRAGFCRVALALALAFPSLSFLQIWIPTPGYHDLGVQALLLAAIGMLIAERTFSKTSMVGWVMIGLGGWLAFMAKPTTASVLAFLVLFYLALSGKLRSLQLLLALTIAGAMLLLTALALDGSPSAFIERLMTGFEDGISLGGGHTAAGVVRWDPWIVMDEHLVAFVGISLGVLCLTLLCLCDRRLALAGMALTFLSASAFLIWLPRNVETFGLADVRSLASIAAGFPLVALIAVAATFLRGTRRFIPLDRGILALVFAIFPLALAFGSNVNYWVIGLYALLFWVLAAVVLILAVSPGRACVRSLMPVIVAAQCLVLLLLSVAENQGYRQPQPIRLQTAEVEIGINGSRLKVADDFARYIVELRDVVYKSSFNPRDPMLDLTGRFPGALYAIGASSVGEPWMIGGYRGSEALALRALARVNCETLSRAWILTEEDGRRALPFSVTGNSQADYREVGALTSPVQAEAGPSFKQRILSPADPAILQSRCEQLRQSAS